ncbi:putative legumain protein [Helianthus annuus]|nr:putative legumain protein [Helianthus annuus]
MPNVPSSWHFLWRSLPFVTCCGFKTSTMLTVRFRQSFLRDAKMDITTTLCRLCHTYQVLRKGRVKEEAVVVMMSDDFSNHPQNKEPGIIRHELGGQDVYFGVRKDYSGENPTLSNLVAVLMGNKRLLNGGSRRVISPNPNGKVFLFIYAHGDDGLVGISEREVVTKEKLFEIISQLFKIISQNYISGKYQSMVILFKLFI